MSLVKKILDKFGKNITSAARKKLKQKGKGNSRLSKSLTFKTVEKNDVVTFTAFAEDYWEFVDRGVVGIGGTKADGTPWKKKRTPDKTFKYKNKRPPTRVFNQWTIRKGIAPRTKGGQFKKRKGLLFAISESVFHTGLETTHFLTTPAKRLLKEIPNQVIKAFGLDLEETLKKSL